MERLPIICLGLLCLAGCGSGDASTVTSAEEQAFKHPAPIDMSKVPANAFAHKGPMYIGQPSHGTAATAKPSGPG